MPKVSIIIPVYNSEKYVGDVIKSILNQTYKDFELILINDGSSDKSGEICEKYADTDQRIKVIHQCNQGLCAARNKGIDEAVGKYICFVDNDDYCYPDYIKDNIELALNYDADVVRFDRLRIQTFENSEKVIKDVTGTKGIVDEKNPVKVMRGEEILENYVAIKRAGALYGIWNAMFKREFLETNQLRFCTDIKYGGEDGLLNLQAVQRANCYVFNKGIYYRYERRYGYSTSTKFHKNRIDTLLYLLKEERKIVNKLPNGEVFWLYNQTDNAIGIMQIVLQKNCDWKYTKKKRYLNYLLQKTEIKNANFKKYIRGVYKQNIMIGIFASLFYRQKFMLCCGLIKAYEKMDKIKNMR